jgi:hypothetical protein
MFGKTDQLMRKTDATLPGNDGGLSMKDRIHVKGQAQTYESHRV